MQKLTFSFYFWLYSFQLFTDQLSAVVFRLNVTIFVVSWRQDQGGGNLSSQYPGHDLIEMAGPLDYPSSVLNNAIPEASLSVASRPDRAVAVFVCDDSSRDKCQAGSEVTLASGCSLQS